MLYIESVDDLEAKLKEAGDKLVVIDFFATWCGPCEAIAPKFEDLAKKYTNVLFYKVDVDETGEVAEKCDVSAMPTFLFFKNGKKVDDGVIGADSNKLEEKIKALQ
ncbi:thioredoxin-like [Mustelus asterias]